MPTVAELEAKIKQFTSELVEAKRQGAIPAVGLPLKLDLGCGNAHRRKAAGRAKEDGWTGVDIEPGWGEVVHDLSREPWPWPDNSVDEVVSSHMFEHVPARSRIVFMNELWRVLKAGAKATIITPYWASSRAYGDMTHEWPPVSEFFYLYLDATWRKTEAPHESAYKCDFSNVIGYAPAPWLQEKCAGRNAEFSQKEFHESIRDHKEAASDMQVTLTARKA
jgi:hypothetical protein